MAGSATVVGQALRDARTRTGLTQADVGAVGCLDHATISDVERGRRQLPRDVAPRVTRALDDGRVYMAVAEEATGGASSPWLDGSAVELHRAVVWAKAMEELEEALDAMRKVMPMVLKPPSATRPEEREQIRAAMVEGIEAKTAVRHKLTILCRDYGFSYQDLFSEHRRELAAKGYLATRR